jgi:tRNA threonylcarbamoyladenosine biosynthesis protein TsaB
MTNLAIECSGTAGSVALFDGETPICYADLDANFSSVCTLAAAIEQIFRGRIKPSVISVTNGPGSFTGLRVGLTTAKMLGLAWNVPIVPVDTLQAIALRASEAVPQSQAAEPILPVINAFRGQVFSTAIQFLAHGKPTVLIPSCVLDAQQWRTNPLGSFGYELKAARILVSGPGLKNYPLVGQLEHAVSYHTVSAEAWNPTAVEVARLGQLGLEAGLAKNAFTLEPNYIRASAAEEKAK